MTDEERARLLLSGPRGRRLCLQLLGSRPFRHGRPAPHDAVAELRSALRGTDLGVVGESDRLATALDHSVDSARYWQESDEEDVLLADDVVAAELAPVADAVARALASQWWAEPMDGTDQHVVGWEYDGVIALPDAVPDGLAQWRADTVDEEAEAQRERPRDVRANMTGAWWSIPNFVGLLHTTRSRLPELAGAGTRSVPVGLSLIEDGMGWSAARTWPVQPPAGARVYEVTGPEAWAALVAAHPLEVTAARRHDWWRATGWDGTWLIPDWAAVATRFDGVHVTVDGYLSAAGRALPVQHPSGPAATVLAGWDPDTTRWLTVVRPGLGEPTDWRCEDDRHWQPAG